MSQKRSKRQCCRRICFHAKNHPRGRPPFNFQISTFPGGLVVRIRRSHRRGRGSIPRLGTHFQLMTNKFENAICLRLTIWNESIDWGSRYVLKSRAPSEDRTHDPWFTRPVLYPLSYGGISQSRWTPKTWFETIHTVKSQHMVRNAVFNGYRLFTCCQISR